MSTRPPVSPISNSPSLAKLRVRAVAIICVGWLLTSCAASANTAKESHESLGEQGMAAYYAPRFAGETTASGEPYNPDAFTAAHPSLPFDTRVRVTRIDGGETTSVVVRINDRGPYIEDRIIDLSRAAAEELGMIQDGIAEVRLEVLSVAE